MLDFQHIFRDLKEAKYGRILNDLKNINWDTILSNMSTDKISQFSSEIAFRHYSPLGIIT